MRPAGGAPDLAALMLQIFTRVVLMREFRLAAR
jgi:hypothetical protein